MVVANGARNLRRANTGELLLLENLITAIALLKLKVDQFLRQTTDKLQGNDLGQLPTDGYSNLTDRKTLREGQGRKFKCSL